MINIHPEFDIKEHVVYKASYIIEYLNNNNNSALVDVILISLIKSKIIMDPNEFFDALCFLYSLDFIEYSNDMIRIKNV